MPRPRNWGSLGPKTTSAPRRLRHSPRDRHFLLPSAHADVRVEEVPIKGDAKVIVLHAKPDPNQRPYLYNGRPYQRSGPTTSHMPVEMLYRQVMGRPENENIWEGRIAEGFTIEGLKAAYETRPWRSSRSRNPSVVECFSARCSSHASKARTRWVVFPSPFKPPEVPIIADSLVLTPLQEQILAMLSATRKTQMRAILGETGAAERTALRAITGLVELGLVEIDGAGRARGYRRHHK